jgi:hypothetical protein
MKKQIATRCTTASEITGNNDAKFVGSAKGNRTPI